MPQQEYRTISRIGYSSMMITLPKGWLRFHRLQPGDKVEVITNGELHIRPLKKHPRIDHEEQSYHAE